MSDLLDRLTAGLAERYHVQRELGSGGMAIVFAAHDLRHDRDVAIKVLTHPLSWHGEAYFGRLLEDHSRVVGLLDGSGP